MTWAVSSDCWPPRGASHGVLALSASAEPAGLEQRGLYGLVWAGVHECPSTRGHDGRRSKS